MLKIVLFVFIALWLLGFIQLSILNAILFTFLGHPFTVHTLLLFGLMVFLINLLPGIFRTIAIILFLLWLLSTFGFMLLGGLTNVIILILIIAVVFSLV